MHGVALIRGLDARGGDAVLLREDFGNGLHALTRKVAVDTRVARTGIGIARNLGFCLGVVFEPLGEGGNLAAA